jgi:hypothetical protein
MSRAFALHLALFALLSLVVHLERMSEFLALLALAIFAAHYLSEHHPRHAARRSRMRQPPC